MIRYFKTSILITTLLMLTACPSKKTESDQGIESTTSGPAIDNTPMSFSASGSDSGAIEGLKTVFFPYDSSKLDSQAKADLKGNAAWMKKNTSVKMQIEGHCDNRGTIEYNLGLGERRANAVKNYLISQGIPASRLNTISYGEEKPLVSGEDEDAWSKNRRANFVPAQ